jgi:hypothetical protein
MSNRDEAKDKQILAEHDAAELKRIAEKYGVRQDILKAYTSDLEDSERLAKLIAEDREAKQAALALAKKNETLPEIPPTKVLADANKDFLRGLITKEELRAIRKTVETQSQASQLEDPLARANEDFRAGLITVQELRTARRKAETEGRASRSEDARTKANEDFAAGIITEEEFREILRSVEVSNE